ncbi:MAG: MBL fold metallo-hydrolase [Erysipelotrichaceae bacterium]|nr:MBL fold metallo-hydrolase [Erysipelotrichaceae bacterium]
MNNYTAQKVSDHVWAIHSCTGEIQYLIEGEDRALLQDTSSGMKGLRALVDSLTDKPLEIILSHGHPDHAMGIREFDVPVWLHSDDMDMYRQMRGLDNPQMLSGILQRQVLPEETVPFDPDFAFQDLKEGMVFDLGGVHVSAWDLKGHTQGSMAFLVEEDGILITGDAANTNTFLFMPQSSSVEDYRNSLQRLLHLLEGRYHRVFLSHRDVDSGVNMLQEGIQVCEDVMNGKTDAVPFEFLGMRGLMAKACNPDLTLNDGTYFNMVYLPEKIFSKSED